MESAFAGIGEEGLERRFKFTTEAAGTDQS